MLADEPLLGDRGAPHPQATTPGTITISQAHASPLTLMKAKWSVPLAGPASGVGGPSVPSVESRSALERSPPVLRCSVLGSCWPVLKVASVWEDDEEDKRPPGDGFHVVVVAPLSGDGDSGAKLKERQGQGPGLRG